MRLASREELLEQIVNLEAELAEARQAILKSVKKIDDLNREVGILKGLDK